MKKVNIAQIRESLSSFLNSIDKEGKTIATIDRLFKIKVLHAHSKLVEYFSHHELKYDQFF